jgi:hypothetical protein
MIAPACPSRPPPACVPELTPAVLAELGESPGRYDDQVEGCRHHRRVTESDLAIVAALVFAWGVLSGRLEKRFDVTAPIIFVAAELALTHGPMAPLGIQPSNELVKAMAEFTLVLVLCSDASRAGLREMRPDLGLYLRLLGLALPLTIGLGTLLAAGDGGRSEPGAARWRLQPERARAWGARCGAGAGGVGAGDGRLGRGWPGRGRAGRRLLPGRGRAAGQPSRRDRGPWRRAHRPAS